MSAWSTGYSTGFGPLPPPPPPPPPDGNTLDMLHAAIVAALETIPEVIADEWTVLPEPTDAVEPPAFVVIGGPDPYLTPDTMCTDTAQVEVACVGARLTPEATTPVLRAMIQAANTALRAAHLRPFQVLAPGPLPIAEVTYMAARVQLRQPVTS